MISAILPLFTTYPWFKKIFKIVLIVIISQLFGVLESLLDRPALGLIYPMALR